MNLERQLTTRLPQDLSRIQFYRDASIIVARINDDDLARGVCRDLVSQGADFTMLRVEGGAIFFRTTEGGR